MGLSRGRWEGFTGVKPTKPTRNAFVISYCKSIGPADHYGSRAEMAERVDAEVSPSRRGGAGKNFQSGGQDGFGKDRKFPTGSR